MKNLKVARTLGLANLNRMEVQGAKYDESHHQAALIQWARHCAPLQTDDLKRRALLWLHSIPNGGGRGAPFITSAGDRLPNLEAVKLKAEGATKGVTDLRLDYVTRDDAGGIACPGLVGEMKVPGCNPSTDQRAYLEFMREQGFAIFVWTEWQRAALDVSGYMDLTNIAPIYVEERGRIRTFSRFSIDLLLLAGL